MFYYLRGEHNLKKTNNSSLITDLTGKSTTECTEWIFVESGNRTGFLLTNHTLWVKIKTFSKTFGLVY